MSGIPLKEVRKTFTPPELKIYGTAQELTQASGNSSASDLVIIGGTVFGGPSGFTTGSTNIVIP